MLKPSWSLLTKKRPEFDTFFELLTDKGSRQAKILSISGAGFRVKIWDDFKESEIDHQNPDQTKDSIIIVLPADKPMLWRIKALAPVKASAGHNLGRKKKQDGNGI